MLILFCNEACLLTAELNLLKKQLKVKVDEKYFSLENPSQKNKKKKQSKVKVNENYILPDSPSQKIECRGRGLVFSWVGDLNNSTI